MSDVVHRLMCLEAVRVHSLPVQGIVGRLQQHPDMVRALPDHGHFPARIRDLGVVIMPVTHEQLVASRTIRLDYGLLTGDSLLVAAMHALGITHLATNNGDFDAVDGIVCWKPAVP